VKLEAGAEAFAHTVGGVDRVGRAVKAAQRALVVAEQLEVVDGEQAELVPDVLAALRRERDVKPPVRGGG